ncbi:hypothetical protein [Amycolatopsis echigonensis]|uniref:hypothetical protein n=1 Tax=Amycolatopsis echigonensis TaxID=2576905 RepID=UPI001C7FA112|nr:hypothetical protein [Amycolatopsis echigonensis]
MSEGDVGPAGSGQEERLVPRSLRCPCGEYIQASDSSALITRVRAHLAASHPGREYSDDEILFMAI